MIALLVAIIMYAGPLFAAKDIPSINSIGDLLILIWQSVNTLLSRAETLSTHKTQSEEVVSILLDCIARSSERKEPSEVRILLMIMYPIVYQIRYVLYTGV